MLLFIYGDCYTQARRQGKSDGEALSYGIISGLTTAATQAVLGGISKLKLTRESLGVFQKIDKVISSVSKNPSVQRVLSTLTYMGKDAASEGFQDYLQSTLDTMIRNVTLDENNKLDLISQDKLYSSMVSAITGISANALTGDYYKRNMDDFQKGFWGVKGDSDSPLNRPGRDFDLTEQFDTLIDHAARKETRPYLDDLLMDFPGYEPSTDADSYHLDSDGSHVWNWLDKNNTVPYTDSGLKKTPKEILSAAKKTDILGTYDCAFENAPNGTLSAAVTEHTVLHLPFAEATDKNGNPIHKVSKKGVRGGHDMDEFYRALAETGIPQEQLVISCTPHPKTNGIYDIEYRIPVYNSKGEIIGLREYQKPKTVYDPRLISERQMYQWMGEALKNGEVTVTRGGQLNFNGYAKNGLHFHGYIENGKFTSLYPTAKIKQTKTSKFFEKIMKKNRGQ